MGYADHELPDRVEEWESRLHPDDREQTLQAAEEYLAGRLPDYDVEFRLRHKDGSYRWIFTRADKLVDENGKPVRIFGCHVDITERKEAEQRLRKRREVPQPDGAGAVLPPGGESRRPG